LGDCRAFLAACRFFSGGVLPGDDGFQATWMVNSPTHFWVSRRFATRDGSLNNWFVALLSFGEGWHNNHHAHPTSARHGPRVVRNRHELVGDPIIADSRIGHLSAPR
jgi:fatty-acid desaturase